MSHYDISKEQLTARFEARRMESEARKNNRQAAGFESVDDFIARGGRVKRYQGVVIDGNYKPLGLPNDYELGD